MIIIIVVHKINGLLSSVELINQIKYPQQLK